MSKTTSRPLNILPEISLSAQQIDRLLWIEQYDLWFVVESVERKDTVPAHLIDVAVTEFRKYVALAALGYDNLGMHSSEVDEIWHSFILFTNEYMAFCRNACGKMIHHRPNTTRRPELPDESVDVFVEAYTRFFGPLHSIWFSDKKQKGRRVATIVDSLSPSSVSVTSGDCDVYNDSDCKSLVSADCDTTNDDPGCKSLLSGECEVVQAPLQQRIRERFDSVCLR